MPIITKNSSKPKPQHNGVENAFKPYYNAYELMALSHGISFKKQVSVGFSHIEWKKRDDDNVIGLCTYGKNFREIDIDYSFWKSASKTTRMTLIFHELTHCLCYRNHDWGTGIRYYYNKIKDGHPKTKILENGYFQDQCPLSIMYPLILSDSCVKKRMKFYLNEMFDRCQPY